VHPSPAIPHFVQRKKDFILLQNKQTNQQTHFVHVRSLIKRRAFPIVMYLLHHLRNKADLLSSLASNQKAKAATVD
jgi:hypothetical protein